ncbi:FAD-dependent oxidoreductase [Rhodobacter sphaeroides]|uniref:Cyclopropane/cyclopropene fatty acid synthesis protein, flavin amine oxidase n=1 Tax=Cereibacter sphaeroides (strain ATCC 17023 / DSM 158 / JCM 6121 / CCUG 31486 / LMG 2827 / NBRC 12203 / NCIMB 8253 / ATH 2.4.1.) TaxID=272943 RepID=Q3IYV7_CERS4|nr:FAD-dependent oxidoreductase [Cereibacter sphaeroides]ABA80277.1 Putative cyclopropane/cyclopropene fatty acid synthesis protein, flavin amine oxidase [Cereibacter sphaeroides 2.4.1]AMJ48515.1 cyclopropane-fatty-acyl-phospholipid synthase [Cereibacter sphaeroides]ANS35232.1 cyclopropane-fatty-acyl-phospholipid synthase [Cereibacter sphaeroides]ATN64285.1 cyclopropane-fatty-acyl-phospholipid synthase [Cereibacter sphaeroides]MVX46607.1 FAD-dependent oxidoreductase [Cereibacter sphaeroides]
MPFETSEFARRRVAVIGGGISGMAAAHLLASDHAVVLFEAEKRLGGHARTVLAGKRGDQPVDTGFIVFNKVNYPHLTRLFDELGVPVAKSDMSFGASVRGGRLEYGLKNLKSVFAQKRNMADPRFLNMMMDVLRFNAHALDHADDPAMTIRELLARLDLGDWFRDYYLLPISGAIWSTPSRGILDFPAQALLRFFQNHALLSHTGQHQWFTVEGGSIEYVTRLQAAMAARGVDLRTGAQVAGVRRADGGVRVRAEGGEWEAFDEVIFATHSDDTLRLLSDATEAETSALGAVRYQPNRAVLHSDPSVMPKRKAAWASWVYVEPDDPEAPIDITYWMNSLQPIPQDDPLFVTLNGTRPVREELVHDVATFRHPVYDLAAQLGVAALRMMNGQRQTWFAGAWMRNGFHEDGFASAVDVVEAMRRRIPASAAA